MYVNSRVTYAGKMLMPLLLHSSWLPCRREARSVLDLWVWFLETAHLYITFVSSTSHSVSLSILESSEEYEKSHWLPAAESAQSWPALMLSLWTSYALAHAGKLNKDILKSYSTKAKVSNITVCQNSDSWIQCRSLFHGKNPVFSQINVPVML